MFNNQNWHKGIEILRAAKSRRDRQDKLKRDAKKKTETRKGMWGGIKGISKSTPARQKPIWSPRRRSDKK